MKIIEKINDLKFKLVDLSKSLNDPVDYDNPTDSGKNKNL